MIPQCGFPQNFPNIIWFCRDTQHASIGTIDVLSLAMERHGNDGWMWEGEDFDYDKYRLNNKKVEYRHKITNNHIDLIIDMFINLNDYLEGARKTIKYIDNNYINIDIPSFTLNNLIINNKGLLGGNLIINIILLNISKIVFELFINLI